MSIIDDAKEAAFADRLYDGPTLKRIIAGLLDQWQPIETAPIKDFDKEKWFLSHSPQLFLSNGTGVYIGSYSYTSKGRGRWIHVCGYVCQPTHWQPLPPAPTKE